MPGSDCQVKSALHRLLPSDAPDWHQNEWGRKAVVKLDDDHGGPLSRFLNQWDDPDPEEE